MVFLCPRQPSKIVDVIIVHVQPLQSPPPSLWRRRREAVHHLLECQSRSSSLVEVSYLQLEAETAYDTGVDEFSALDYVIVQVLGLRIATRAVWRHLWADDF